MTRPPTLVSLCSGIGGLDLGLERAGFEVAAQVELDPYCRAILARHWPGVPRHDDIASFPTWWQAHQRPRVDLVCAGFPCQPVSDAGRRQAQADPRWLWPQVARCVRLLRPRLVLVENVPGLLHRGMGDVLADLARLGYDTQWDCLAAADVGAPHLRRRVFILAHPADGWRRDGLPQRDQQRHLAASAAQRGTPGTGRHPTAAVADADGVSIKKPHQPASPDGQAPPRRDHPAGRGQAVADPDSGRRPAAERQLPARQPDAGGSGALADPQGQRRPPGPPEAPGPGGPAGGGAVAHPDSGQPQRPRGSGELAGPQDTGAGQGPQRQRDRHAAGGRGQAVADPQGQRRGRVGRLDQEPRPTLGPVGPGRHGAGQRDAAEPGVGGGTDGPPARLDRAAGGLDGTPGFPGWPAPPGQRQHDWEPPRTIPGRQPHRTRRLAALGNAVVPQVAEVAGRWAMTVLDQLDHAGPCTPTWPDLEGVQP